MFESVKSSCGLKRKCCVELYALSPLLKIFKKSALKEYYHPKKKCSLSLVLNCQSTHFKID